MAVVAKPEQSTRSPHNDFFCTALQGAIEIDRNPAAKNTYESLLKNFQDNTKGISNAHMDEFYKLVGENEALDQVVDKIVQKPKQNVSLTARVFTPVIYESRTPLRQIQLQVAENTDHQTYLNNRISELEQSLQQVKKACDDECDSMRKKLGDQTDDIDRLGKKNKSLTEIVDQKEDEIRKLKNIIAHLEDENRKHDKQIQQLKDSLKTVEDTVEELKDENNKLKDHNSSIDRQYAKLQQELEETRKQVGIDEARKEDLMLGQVIVDFEKMFYLYVHPKADKRRNHQVKAIEQGFRKFYKTESDKKAAMGRWAKAKQLVGWDPDLSVITKEIRDGRNVVAHPEVSPEERKELLESLRKNIEVPEEDFNEYLRIFNCFEKLEELCKP